MARSGASSSGRRSAPTIGFPRASASAMAVNANRDMVRLDGSVFEPIANDAEKCAERVLQTDFLAFFVSPARVTDRYFVHAPSRLAPPRDLRRDFRLKTKSVRLQFHAFEHLAAKDLVARL